MKHSHQRSVTRFLLALIASSFVATATLPAGSNSMYRGEVTSANNAQLLVWRAADFGYSISLDMYIDGIPLTSLHWNEAYKAVVRPGEHVLSLITHPSPYGSTRRTNHRVHMRPGETYRFTAIWTYAELPVLKSGHIRIGTTGW